MDKKKIPDNLKQKNKAFKLLKK
ncbi:hypothetical protein PI23P_12172 [Polaribacter irgensii 23-P]|uniref:Uncharacterized protein n=1 Tax=Polaribacter irgensii 23-P TaxID=313594 RepID=A4C1T7_9FLAO|nr:hypothetical protein PI23P_12172 [Polaribacter irgensii 23-P]